MSEPAQQPDAGAAPVAEVDAVPSATVTSVPAVPPDPSVLDRISEELLSEVVKKQATLKEVMRALEAELGLPTKYLSAFKEELTIRIQRVFQSQSAEENGGAAENKQEGEVKVDGEKKKKKKKKKSKDANGEVTGEEEQPRKKTKLTDAEAEEDEEEGASSDEEEEEEEENDYEYGDFVVKDEEGEEGEAEDSSSTSSSSSSGGGADSDDEGKKRRLVQEDDVELDEDDQLLIQDNLQQLSGVKPTSEIPKKKQTPANKVESEDELEAEEEKDQPAPAAPTQGEDGNEFIASENEDEQKKGIVDELSSGHSSGVEDSDDMGDFIEDDDLPEDEDEADRERRRRRRARRRERRAKRDAQKKGLINMEDIPQELQDLFAECFALDGFDLYLPDGKDVAVDEVSGRTRLLAQDEVRAMYLTQEDEEVRQHDAPERFILARRETEFLLNVEAEDQLEMQAYYVSNRTNTPPPMCRVALDLLQREQLEPPCVHLYFADQINGMDLDTLWKVFDAGMDFQVILQKLLNVLNLVKEKVSSEEQMEETLAEDDFWSEPIVSSLFKSDEEEEGEGEMTQSKSMRHGWLRLLYRKRLSLTHEFLDDCVAFLTSHLINGEDFSKRSAGGGDESKRQAIAQFHLRMGSPLALGLAVQRGYNNGSCRPRMNSRGTTPEMLAEEMLVNDPITLAWQSMAHLMWKEPHLRLHVRDMFLRGAVITTERTTRGMRVITDESSRFYSVSNIQNKPLEVYLSAMDSLSTPRDVNNAEQMIAIEQARREGVIDVIVSNQAEFKHALADQLGELFCTGSADDSEWDALRRKCLHSAVEKLCLLGKESALKHVTKKARECLLKRVARSLFNRAFVAPVNFATLDSPEESSSIYADVPAASRVFASIVLSDDPRSSPSFFVALNSNGLEKFRQVLDSSSVAKLESQIERCIEQSQPHVVALHAHSRIRQLSMSLERLARTLNESFSRKKKKQQEDAQWKGWFVSFVLQDDFASAYASSKQAMNEFPREHVNFKRAIAMARYLIDPLTIYCCLATDLTLASSSPLTSLSLHPLQDQLATKTLAFALERELINAVSFSGVDLNDAIAFAHKQPMLAFICGLGFRKSSKLVKDLRGHLVKSRGKLLLRRLMGEKVFENCAGFVWVGQRSSLEDKWDGDGEAEEEEADDDENEETEPWMSRSRMDLTRIHPKFQYELCCSFTKHFCEMKENGSSMNAAIAFTLRTLAMIRHDPSFVEKRQTELFKLFDRTRSLHFDPLSPVLNGALSQDGLPVVFEQMSDPERTFALGFIMEELRFPFGQKRQVLRRPTDQEILVMSSGGEDIAKKDSDVVFEVLQVPRLETKTQGDGPPRLDATILGRVSGTGGVRVVMRLTDGDLCPQDTERKQIIKSLVHAVNDAPNVTLQKIELDKLLLYLERELHVFVGATLEGKIYDASRFPLRVTLKPNKSKVSSAVDSILEGFSTMTTSEDKESLDEYFHPIDFASQIRITPQQQQQQPAFRSREIQHPNFRNWSEKQTEEYLSSPERKVGDCIVRPSSRSLSLLNITWRWSKDPCKLETLVIEERNLDNTPKDASVPTIGSRLVMKDREFDALDEIIALYLDPIGKRITELQGHKYYRAMTLSEIEGLVRDQRLQNPSSIPYYFIPHSSENRTFYLVYQNTNSGPKRLRVIVRPEGFDLVNKRSLRSINELVDYFKRHTRELEEANVRSTTKAVAPLVSNQYQQPRPSAQYVQQQPYQMPPPMYPTAAGYAPVPATAAQYPPQYFPRPYPGGGAVPPPTAAASQYMGGAQAYPPPQRPPQHRSAVSYDMGL